MDIPRLHWEIALTYELPQYGGESPQPPGGGASTGFARSGAMVKDGRRNFG